MRAGSEKKGRGYSFFGRVKVDGKVVLLPAYGVDEGNEVTVNGSRVQPESKVYVVMNKLRAGSVPSAIPLIRS